MGNSQTALSGIHPFKDENDPAGLPAPPMIQFPTFPSALEELTQQESHGPQQVTIGPASPRWIEATQGNKFDDLFVMKAPTPPPRRPSEPLRGTLRGKQSMKSGFSLRSLPKMIGRPDLSKLSSLLRWKKKRKSGEVYPVPPDAEKPSPPSKPEVFLENDEYFLLRWDPPAYDGGLPIIGYIIQHLELGLPQIDAMEKDETQSWYSSEPGQVTSTEVLLNNLIEGTTYQFRIIAENLLGYSQPGPLSDPIVFNPRGILNDYFCAPVLVIPLAETYNAIEHERVVLSIEITGQPYPIVKWYNRNEEEVGGIGGDPRFLVTSCGQKRLLTIAGVECTDSGGIRVVGENEKGIVECKTTLVVEAPPHIRRVQRLDLMKSEDPQELPTDEQKLLKRRDSRNDEELIFHMGELAKFKFLWSASPYPNICVYHEGDLVDGEETGADRGRVKSERVVTEVTDNLITVKINGITRADRGEWMVRLDNGLGEDNSVVIVTVTDRPSRTGKPDVLQLSDNTVILKWDKPQDDGGCPVQGYIVEYFRSEWGVWLKACTTKNPYTKIRDLIPGSKYKFRVKAENLYGVSEPSEDTVELLITDLASTLRSVSGDGEGANLLMTTVEEEEEEAVPIEEEEPGKEGDSSRPTAPRRKFDRGSTASLMRVSTSTMTELSGLAKGRSGSESVETATQRRPSPSPVRLEPEPPQPIRRSPSPSAAKFLSVSFQPQVVVLADDDEELMGEDVLQPPEIAPRKSPETIKRSPSPRMMNVPPSSEKRSPSPRPRHLIRTTVQQLDIEEEEENPAILGESPMTDEIQAPRPPPRHVPPPPPRQVPPPAPVQIEFQHSSEAPKKLYSRAEIIKSAATNELDYYYFGLSDTSGAEGPPADEHHDEPEEEDPEILRVKEALKNDTLFDDIDDEEDEDEYEYDFDKLREEYEEDKKKGMVSRQDSGVSGRSGGRTDSIEEEPSFAEYQDEDDPNAGGRAASVQSERVAPVRPPITESFRAPFERAQSEVVGAASRAQRDDDYMDRGRQYRPSRPPPNKGSGTFLTDRYADLIAMRVSSKNKAIGSSLRSLSLSGSRYSSTENMVGGRGGSISRDSGRSSMVVPERGEGGGPTGSGDEKPRREEPEPEGEEQNTVINRVSLVERPFTFREFRAEEEVKGLKGLEGSRSSWGSKRSVSSLPYDLVHPVQTGASRKVVEALEVAGASCDQDESEEAKELAEAKEEAERKKRKSAPPVSIAPNPFISNPDIFLMMTRGDGGRRGREGLEHSKSETNFDTWIPDSVLKMRAGSFVGRGGCGGEDTTEEDYSYGESGSADIGFEREPPADRRGARERRSVSFGMDGEEDFSYEEEYEKIQEEEGVGDRSEEIGVEGEEAPRLEEISEECGEELYEEEELPKSEAEGNEGNYEGRSEEYEHEHSEEAEHDLAERDFGEMPEGNVWVEEHLLEEYSEESEGRERSSELGGIEEGQDYEDMPDKNILDRALEKFPEEENIVEEGDDGLEFHEEKELELLKEEKEPPEQPKLEADETNEDIPQGEFEGPSPTKDSDEILEKEPPSKDLEGAKEELFEDEILEESVEQSITKDVEENVEKSVEESEESLLVKDLDEVVLQTSTEDAHEILQVPGGEPLIKEPDEIVEELTEQLPTKDLDKTVEEPVERPIVPTEEEDIAEEKTEDRPEETFYIQEKSITDQEELKTEPEAPGEEIVTEVSEDTALAEDIPEKNTKQIPLVEQAKEIEPDTVTLVVQPELSRTQINTEGQCETKEELELKTTEDEESIQIFHEDDDLLKREAEAIVAREDEEELSALLFEKEVIEGLQFSFKPILSDRDSCDYPSEEPAEAEPDTAVSPPIELVETAEETTKVEELDQTQGVEYPVTETCRQPEIKTEEDSASAILKAESDTEMAVASEPPKTIETSVQLEDTLIVEDVVFGKVDLEMNLQRLNEMSAKIQTESNPRLPQLQPPSNSPPPPTPSPIEDEIDKEILSLTMTLPSHHRTPSYSEPRRTISIDRLSVLTPVEEELMETRAPQPSSPPYSRPPARGQPPQASSSSTPAYRPHMSVYYDRVMLKGSSPSVSSSRISILSQLSSTSTLNTTRPTSPFHLEEDNLSLDISEIRQTILNASAQSFIESISSASSSPSRPSTPHPMIPLEEEEYYSPTEISPFMNYLFNGAFYLMLSPMLLFVDSLYLALVCLVVVACVHFFIIKF